MNYANIDLNDPHLFGNDAAELEDEAIFDSYKLERDEVAAFADPQNRIRVARAYKGEGKSALLRLTRGKLDAGEQRPLVIATTGPSVSPSLDSDDSDRWVRAWKASLFQLIASELGAKIGMAWSDDATSLVEEAERNGYKSRSLLSSLFDRLKCSQVPIERIRLGAPQPEKVVQRFMRGEPTTWMLIDDIDQNFQNTPLGRLKVASLFTACRQMAVDVPELRLRLAVRPNVWTTIKREFESLSHIEQYITNLTWDQQDIRRLLAQRIEGYLKRSGQDAVLGRLRDDAWPRDETIIAFVFEAPMRWGTRDRPPHVVLATLSRYRPRWLVELCKVAAQAALNGNRQKIVLADITGELRNFGRRRIDDTIAEFRAQCPEIEHLIAAFAQQPERYQTNELFEVISRRILPSVNPRIVGVVGRPSSTDVAHFLFEIGFLTGRRDSADGSYEHVSFNENPSLLHAKTNIDQGLSWEVHPVFRQALDLTDKDRKNRRGGR